MTRRLVAVAVLVGAVMVAAPAGASDAPMAIMSSSPVQTLQQAVRVNPPAPPATAPAAPASPAYEVVALVNAERAAHGLPALQIDDRLMLAAQLHSADQAAMDRMSHTGSDGSNVGVRLDRVGFSYRSWSENVAYGYGSAAGVVEGWMNSPGHRANNLSGQTHVGVGLAYAASGRPYWTMDFGTPR